MYKDLVGDIDVPDGQAGQALFDQILALPGSAILGAVQQGNLVSMATLHLLPNLTFGGRSYGLVENVVTLHTHKGQGIGRRVMTAILERAWEHDAYKVMLLTGRDLGARGFYEKLGFSADQKHGMILRRAPNRRPTT